MIVSGADPIDFEFSPVPIRCNNNNASPEGGVAV